MGALYLITSPSGKQYVGVTTWSAAERYAEHCRIARGGRGYAVHRAIAKYGADSMKVETLAVSDDQQALLKMEIQAIKEYGTLHPNGYNLTAGGEGILGLADDARMRRAAAAKGRVISAEQREKNRLAAVQQMQRPGMRERLSAAAKARTVSPEQKQKVSATCKATHNTPEMRARISAATKAAFSRPEILAKLSARSSERWSSADERAAHSRKIRAKWADPAWREATLKSRALAHAMRKESKKSTNPLNMGGAQKGQQNEDATDPAA